MRTATEDGNSRKTIEGLFLVLALVLVALLMAPCYSLASDSNYLTDRALLSPVYDVSPTKGAVVVDSATGATLEKKTDYTELIPASSRSMIVYSRFSPANSSNQFVLVHGDNSTSSHVYRISDNVKVASLTYDGIHTIGEINEIRWDYTGNYPNRVYFVVGKKFFQMDVLNENGAAKLIRDFATDFPEGSVIANDVEGDSSNDSRYWAWQVLDKSSSPYATRLIFTYDKQTDTIVGVLRPADVGQATTMSRPNMVEISPLGNKVITHYGAASTHPSLLNGAWVSVGNGVWELSGYKAKTSGNNAFALVTANGAFLAKMSPSTGTAANITGDNQYANNSALDKFWVRIAAGADPNGQAIVADWGTRPADVGTAMDAPRAWDLNFTNPVIISVGETHSGWAFDAEGREWFVSQNNKTDWIEAHDILTGQAMNILYHGDIGWSNGFHFGKFYDRSQRGWLMMSTYSKLGTEWGNNQTMLVELKPSSQNPTVWRITPLYNRYAGDYRDEGSAALSCDGKSVFWTANWGNANGHGDVFRTILPQNWYEHFAGDIHPDTMAPTVVSFGTPSTVQSLTVPINEFTAADSMGIAGYLITETDAKPDAYFSGWSEAVPATYTFSSNGSKMLYAWAKDAAGNVSVCKTSSVEVQIYNAAPEVSIASPTSNSTASGSLAVLVNVGASVIKVELYVNGLYQATSTSATYGFVLDTSIFTNGYYSLSVKAYDAAGNTALSSPVSVKVYNDTTVPAISIATSASSIVMGGTVAVSANCSDDVAVTKVDFYVNGVLKATMAGAPFSYNWNTASLSAGTYILSANAYDAAGNIGKSNDVSVKINSDKKAPTISSLSPAGGTRVGSVTAISAIASDNAAVMTMNLYIDGVLKFSSAGNNLLWTWDSSSYAKGSHSIKVLAYDAAKNVGSKAVTVYK